MTSMTAQTQIHYLPTSLRASILAASYWILSLSLTVVSGSIAAFVGCLAACYLVDASLHKTPWRQLRLPVISAFCLALFFAAILIAELMTGSSLFMALASPISIYNTSEFIRWLGISLALTTLMRALAHRTGWGAIVEILFVASAFVLTLAAHRNGMIHRPFFIGDFALTRGIDPSSTLMALGCGAVLSLAALLMMENNQRRLPYHFIVLGLLCFSLLGYVRFFGLPTPQLTDDLGLTGQEQTGNSSERENPFRDGENTASDKEAPVAVVVFRDDYEPLNGAYYFRETAYSQFNGTMLDVANRSDMDRDLVDHFTNTRAEPEEEIIARQQRNTVHTTIGTLVPHRSPFGLDSPAAFESRPNPNNLRFKRTYDVYSLAPEFEFENLLGREVGNPAWNEDLREEYLKLPDDPRYRELATDIVADLRPEYAGDPFAKAFSIKSYLDENGIYSLKNEHAYEQDPAASFLFGDLTGYCMHFAFAATYMYRSLGLPARVGIGYSVPASNRAGGSSLLIQAINGHAWPEVYFEGLGWVIIDPAPQQTLVDMSVDPQDSLQQMLGDMLRDESSFQEYLASQQSSMIPWQAMLNAIYLLMLLTLVSGYAVKYYRLWIPYHTSEAERYRLSYRAVLDKLAAVGIRRRYGESREAFALRVGNMAPSFPKITRGHLSHALGGEHHAGPQALDWASLDRSVADELEQQTPLWKRVLAAVNPYSWLLTR
ncbi:MAG: transglutaminase domain-containing protein [Pseudohongiellaceae bacterium]